MHKLPVTVPLGIDYRGQRTDHILHERYLQRGAEAVAVEVATEPVQDPLALKLPVAIFVQPATPGQPGSTGTKGHLRLDTAPEVRLPLRFSAKAVAFRFVAAQSPVVAPQEAEDGIPRLQLTVDGHRPSSPSFELLQQRKSLCEVLAGVAHAVNGMLRIATRCAVVRPAVAVGEPQTGVAHHWPEGSLRCPGNRTWRFAQTLDLTR